MVITTNIKGTSIYVYAFATVLVLLPWSFKLCTYAIIVMSVFGIFSTTWRQKVQQLKWHPQVFIFLLFYLLYVVGMIYTDNLAEGLKSLEQKLALVAIPLIVSTSIAFSEQERRVSAMAFVFSNLLLTIECCVLNLISLSKGEEYRIINFDLNTLARFTEIHNSANPLWMRFSYVAFGHASVGPTYLSMYLVLCLAILFYDPYENRKWAVVKWGIACWFFIVIILLASRMGIILLGIIGVLIILAKGKSKLMTIGYVMAFFLLLGFTIYISPVTRFRVLEEPRSTPLALPDAPKQWNSINLRLLEWGGGVDGIKKAGLLGTGTGGTITSLKNYYHNFDLGDVSRYYSSHNQYIETFLEIGLGGFLALIGCYLFPLIFAVKNDDKLVLYLVLIAMFSGLTATVLERAYGIIFYTSFVSLFMFTKKIHAT